jgi:hypothetical protein
MIDPLRTCSRCQYWREQYTARHEEGYLLAVCEQPPDARDRKQVRGGDTCQHWSKR